MYARNVSLTLKPNCVAEFTRALENDVIPMLRKQKGFRDEIVLVAPDRYEVMAISFWNRKEDAEAYNRDKYPAILKSLEKLVEGTPEMELFEVSNSTTHHIADKAEPSQTVARS